MKRAIHNYNTPDHDVQAHNSIKEKTKTNCEIVSLINPCVEMYCRGNVSPIWREIAPKKPKYWFSIESRWDIY